MAAHEQLKEINKRIADVDSDLNLLSDEMLEARRSVEDSINNEDSTLYQMLNDIHQPPCGRKPKRGNMTAHEQLKEIDKRLAGLDDDLNLLSDEMLEARRSVEESINNKDSTLYAMLKERVDIIEGKQSFVRKQKYLLLKERAPALVTVNQEDAAFYSITQASLRKELTKQVAAEKAQLERGLTQFVAKLAYSQGSFAGSISLDRVFSECKKGADPLISKFKREGIR